jgi:hypothetical protein
MSIAGKWHVTMQTPVGTMKFAWDFANDTGGWRGRMIGQGPVGDSELRLVRLNGDALSFETTTKSPMGPLQLTFIGTVMADSMTGTCKTKFGDNQFSAVRA